MPALRCSLSALNLEIPTGLPACAPELFSSSAPLEQRYFCGPSRDIACNAALPNRSTKDQRHTNNSNRAASVAILGADIVHISLTSEDNSGHPGVSSRRYARWPSTCTGRQCTGRKCPCPWSLASPGNYRLVASRQGQPAFPVLLPQQTHARSRIRGLHWC